MNILQIQDDLKNFSEQQLINEMQRPSGNAPQYLVLSEINRRKRVKSEYQANQAADTNTVAEEAVASAGVPMSGIAGMAEAMAPKSESSLVAPRTQPMPMREGGEVDYYANGGLIEGIAENVNQNAEVLQQLTESQAQTSKMLQDQQNAANTQTSTPAPATPIPSPITQLPPAITRPITQPYRPIFAQPAIGIGSKGRRMPFDRQFQQTQNMAEGGVVNAFSGKFFDSSGRPTQELLRAMILQESGGDTKARGSLDEVGLAQIRPSTAIKPGFGVKSLFPELESQIGKGKKYSTVAEAYEDNKELVDKRLEEGSTSKDFMSDYLTGLRKNTDTDAGAISAYNVGLGGLKNIKNPADFKYFTEVSKKMNPVQYDGRPMKSGILSAEAGTLDSTNKELNAAQKRAAKRGGGAGSPDSIFDIFKPTTKIDGPTGQMKRGDSNLFNIEQKRKDLPKTELETERDKRRPDKKKLAELRKEFPFVEEKEDIYSEGTFATPTDDKKLEEQANKFFEDRNVVQKEPESKDPEQSSDKSQAPTLDEQLASMQEDLKKGREQDKWLAIAQAGLSIMASDKPTLGGAIGEGASVGLQAYRDAQERYNEGVIDILNARAKLAKNKSSFTRKDALSAINSYNTQITKLLADREGIFDDKEKENINNKIKNLEFQKSQLLPFAGIISRDPISKQTYMGS